VAYFFKPDDAQSLASLINHVLSHEEEAKGKAQKAFERVKQYSWEERTRNILRFIGRI